MINQCREILPPSVARAGLVLRAAWVAIVILGSNISVLPVRGQEPNEKAEPSPKHKSDYAKMYHHTFNGDREIGPDFYWHGLEPQNCVAFEPEGMRITLPTGHPGKRMGTGIGIDSTIKGDFEITLRFEILKEPEAPDAGAETGVFMWVDMNKLGLNRGFISRGIRNGKQFVVWYHLAAEPPEKPVDVLRPFPAHKSSGQFRLVRTGPMLYYYVAEGNSKDFKLLQKHTFGTDDLQSIRWGGQTGGPKASLEARFLDIRVRADELPDLPDAGDPAAATGQGAGTPAKERIGARWIVLGVGVGFVLLLLLAVSIGLILRWRSTPIRQSPGELASAQLSFACPDCGKRMKVRAELGGRKVKCPQCGQAVLAPRDGVEESPA